MLGQATQTGRKTGDQPMQIDIQGWRQMGTLFMCRQTFRYAGRLLHMYADMQAWRQVASYTCR